MVRLSRAGLRVSASESQLATLAARFAERHLIRLPRFIDDDLAALLDERLARATFAARVEDGLEIEETPNDAALDGACHFLMNDPRLFAVIERLTGCPALRVFTGRIYRRSAREGGGHYFPWHDDVVENRQVAISINLGREPYAGGVLQLRDAATHAAIGEVHNAGHGDAMVFRVSPLLEHRVTPVTGPGSRTAWAGWFRS